MKRISTLLLIVGISTLMINSSSIAGNTKGLSPITQKNWATHPRIIEIRKIYKNIRTQLDNKALEYIEKDFSKLPRECRGTYPVERLAVAFDKNDNVYLYIHAQRISHDDLLTKEHYFDSNGRLRFVFMSNKSDVYATIENRVYISDKSKVFWDVKKEGKNTTFGEITAQPYQIRSYTNKHAKKHVESTKVECRE